MGTGGRGREWVLGRGEEKERRGDESRNEKKGEDEEEEKKGKTRERK